MVFVFRVKQHKNSLDRMLPLIDKLLKNKGYLWNNDTTVVAVLHTIHSLRFYVPTYTHTSNHTHKHTQLS